MAVINTDSSINIVCLLLGRLSQLAIAACCYKWSSAVGLSVCLRVSHVRKPCKNSLTDRDAVWGLTHVGPWNHLLNGAKVERIHSPPRGVHGKKAMRPFTKLL